MIKTSINMLNNDEVTTAHAGVKMSLARIEFGHAQT